MAPPCAWRARRGPAAGAGEHLLTFPVLEGQTRPLAFSPDRRLLACNNFNCKRQDAEGKPGHTGNTLYLWETATAAELLQLPVASNTRVSFSRDGRV